MKFNYVLRVMGIGFLLVAACAVLLISSTGLQAESDPWTKDQTVQPADLARELENTKAAPTVIFVGFQRLYTAGHIKGAVYHGTAGNPEGLKEFTSWVAALPRTTSLLIYCGCCPLEHCPNIRPAFKTLQELGFKKVHVLLLPNDFATDWAAKGFAYDKGN